MIQVGTLHSSENLTAVCTRLCMVFHKHKGQDTSERKECGSN